MTEQIIFTLLIIVSLILSIKSQNKWNIALTLAFSVGFIVMWTKIEGSMLFGSILILLSTLVITGYGLIGVNYTVIEKWLVGSVGSVVLLQLLSTVFHWQMYTISRLLIIVP